MIQQLSIRIAKKLLSDGYLTAAEEDEVIYGLFTSLSRVIFAAICISLGIVFRSAIESVVFYCSFLFVKRYAGGFHASTESRCFIISTTSIALSICFISFCQTAYYIRNLVFILTIIAGAIISFFSPVATAEKPLDINAKKRYRLFSVLRVIILFSIISILYCLSIYNVCIAICASILLEGLFLIAGHFKNKMIST